METTLEATQTKPKVTEVKDRLIQDSTILFLSSVLVSLGNYLFHFYMVRALGPADYGILVSLLAVLMITALPLSTVQTVVTKYASAFHSAGDLGRLKSLFLKVLKKLSWGGAIVFILFLLGNSWISQFLHIQSRMPVLFLGFIMSISIVVPVCLGTLQGLQRFLFLGLYGVFFVVLKLGFGILFVRMGMEVNGGLLACFIAGLIGLALAFYVLKPVYRVKEELQELNRREIYGYLVPVGAALICYGVLTYVDVILVKHYFEPIQAGYYSVASLVGKAFLIPSFSLGIVLFTKVSNHHIQKRETFSLLKKSLLYNGVILFAGILVSLLFPKLILMVIMKKGDLTAEAFSTLIPLLRLFGIAMTPLALLYLFLNYYLARHEMAFIYIVLVGAVSFVGSIVLFHSSLFQVLSVVGINGFLILGASGLLLKKSVARATSNEQRAAV